MTAEQLHLMMKIMLSINLTLWGEKNVCKVICLEHPVLILLRPMPHG